MGIPSNPILLALLGVLVVLSTVVMWKAFRRKDYILGIMGVGLSFPTFSIENDIFWFMGAGVTGLGWWMRKMINQ